LCSRAAYSRPQDHPAGGVEERSTAVGPCSNARGKLILVEAASNSLADLMQAEWVASNLVAAAGVDRSPTAGAAANSLAKPHMTQTSSKPA
jgi:hypothetical protein